MTPETQNINIGISPDTIEATSNGISSLSETIANAIRPFIENYGGNVHDMTLIYLRVDAFSTSLFPFAASIITMIALYLLCEKVFSVKTIEYSNPDLVRGLLKKFGDRNADDDSVISSYFDKKSSDVDQMTIEEMLESKLVQKMTNNKKWVMDEDSILHLTIVCVSVIFAMFAVIYLILSLGNIWSWIGMFYPELYGVHMAVGKL